MAAGRHQKGGPQHGHRGPRDGPKPISASPPHSWTPFSEPPARAEQTVRKVRRPRGRPLGQGSGWPRALENLTWGTSPCCVFRRPAPHTSSFVAATERTSEPEGDLLQSIVGRQTLKRELRRWALAAVAAALCPGSRAQDSTPPPRAALGRHRRAGWRGPWSSLSWWGAGVAAGAWKWLPENTGGAGGSEGTPFSPMLPAQTVISFGKGRSRTGSPRDLLRPRNLPEGLVSATTMLCGHGPAHTASCHGHTSCPSPPGGRQAWRCPGACEFRSAARASLVRGPVATSTAVLTAGD